MQVRSILFARPMVVALLAGRKTQTRRGIFPPPPPGQAPRRPGAACPFGGPGDWLWVRERWGYRSQFFQRGVPAGGEVVYGADGPPADSRFEAWRSSLHMPRSACRLLLEIRACRPERLQAITPEDARAEGCPEESAADPVAWFRGVWEGLHGGPGSSAAGNTGSNAGGKGDGKATRKGPLAWADNPWVWVVSFRRLGYDPDLPRVAERIEGPGRLRANQEATRGGGIPATAAVEGGGVARASAVVEAGEGAGDAWAERARLRDLLIADLRAATRGLGRAGTDPAAGDHR